MDSGCSTSIIAKRFCYQIYGRGNLVTFDGRKANCVGLSRVQLVVRGTELRSELLVSENLLSGVDVILGMDLIFRLGGVKIDRERVTFGVENDKMLEEENKCARGRGKGGRTTLVIEDKDFHAEFNGQFWEVSWKWKREEPQLSSAASFFGKKFERRFKTEI